MENHPVDKYRYLHVVEDIKIFGTNLRSLKSGVPLLFARVV